MTVKSVQWRDIILIFNGGQKQNTFTCLSPSIIRTHHVQCGKSNLGFYKMFTVNKLEVYRKGPRGKTYGRWWLIRARVLARIADTESLSFEKKNLPQIFKKSLNVLVKFAKNKFINHRKIYQKLSDLLSVLLLTLVATIATYIIT